MRILKIFLMLTTFLLIGGSPLCACTQWRTAMKTMVKADSYSGQIEEQEPARNAVEARAPWQDLPSAVVNRIACHLNPQDDFKSFQRIFFICRGWRNGLRGTQSGDDYSNILHQQRQRIGSLKWRLIDRKPLDANNKWRNPLGILLSYFDHSGFVEDNGTPTVRSELVRNLFYTHGECQGDRAFSKGTQALIDVFARKYGQQELICLQDAMSSHIWWHTKVCSDGCYYHEGHDRAHEPLLVPLENLSSCYTGQVRDYINWKISEAQMQPQRTQSIKQKALALFHRYYTAPMSDGRWTRIVDNWLVPSICNVPIMLVLNRCSRITSPISITNVTKSLALHCVAGLFSTSGTMIPPIAASLTGNIGNTCGLLQGKCVALSVALSAVACCPFMLRRSSYL